MEGSMELKLDLQSSNLNKALGSASSSGDPAVKVENPKFLDMKQELGIAQSMKASLEKVFNSTDTMHKDLSAENKPETKDMLKLMIPVFKGQEAFGSVQVLRYQHRCERIGEEDNWLEGSTLRNVSLFHLCFLFLASLWRLL